MCKHGFIIKIVFRLAQSMENDVIPAKTVKPKGRSRNLNILGLLQHTWGLFFSVFVTKKPGAFTPFAIGMATFVDT